MTDDIIGMADMRTVFAVTDALGISRELVSVPLEKADPGSVRRLASGEIEIVVPRTIQAQQWLETLRKGLAELGFQRPPRAG
jgi:hypothetical protein